MRLRPEHLSASGLEAVTGGRAAAAVVAHPPELTSASTRRPHPEQHFDATVTPASPTA